jgi:hypothetical protein
MPTTCLKLDIEFEPDARLAFDQSPWPGTRGATRPAVAWLESRRLVGGTTMVIHFVRRPAAERHMGPVEIVPRGQQTQLVREPKGDRRDCSRNDPPSKRACPPFPALRLSPFPSFPAPDTPIPSPGGGGGEGKPSDCDCVASSVRIHSAPHYAPEFSEGKPTHLPRNRENRLDARQCAANPGRCRHCAVVGGGGRVQPGVYASKRPVAGQPWSASPGPVHQAPGRPWPSGADQSPAR